jgi:hypothetical protein
MSVRFAPRLAGRQCGHPTPNPVPCLPAPAENTYAQRRMAWAKRRARRNQTHGAGWRKGRAYTVTTAARGAMPAQTRGVTVWLSTDLRLAVLTRVGDSYERSYTNIGAGVELSADLFTVRSGFKEAAPTPSRARINQSCRCTTSTR